MHDPPATSATLLGRLRQDRALPVVLSSFVATRLIVVVALALGASRLPRLYHRGLFTEIALMWDGAWYAGIARDGYAMPPAPNPSNLAFPPLLPLLAHLAGAVFARLGLDAGDPAWGSWALAGVLISNGSFLAALYVLRRLVALDHPATIADRTVWLVAAAPVGVFWSAFYTESLFLLLAASCLMAARRGAWAPAALLAGLATLTRWPGVILIGVLFVEWYAARAAARAGATTDAHPRVTTGRAVAWLGLAPLPLLGFAFYLQRTFGDPWAVLRARAAWGQDAPAFFLQSYLDGVSLLWQSVTQAGPARDRVLAVGEGTSLYMWLDLGMPLLYLALGWAGRRRGWLRPGDLAWLVGGVVFPLSISTTAGLARYALPLWPALIVLARLGAERPWVAWTWRLVTVALLATTAYLFGNARWIG
jgi:hypothetical protein